MYCQRCGGTTTEKLVDGRLRPVCDACGAVTWLDPKLAVTVVILRDTGETTEVLLGKRGAGTRNPGTWSFPAGFVERGEVVEAAAIRETLDETGLSVDLGPLLGVWSHEGEAVVLLAYLAAAHHSEASAADDFEDVAWLPVEAVPPLSFAHDAEILAKALAVWQGGALADGPLGDGGGAAADLAR